MDMGQIMKRVVVILDFLKVGLDAVLGKTEDPKKKAIARAILAFVTAASLGLGAYRGCEDGSVKSPTPAPIERKASP